MKLSTCPKGHFYDADKYASCPYCVPQDEAEAVTEALNVTMEDFSTRAPSTGASAAGAVQQPVSVQTSGAAQQAASGQTSAAVPTSEKRRTAFVNTAVSGWEEPEEDENCTVGYYAQVIGVEPVVGWMVCIKGAYRGESFKLKADAILSAVHQYGIVLGADQSVSRLRHAAVVYDPKSRAFIVAAGDARELCYLNGEVVVTSQKLKAYDVLTLGNTELMLIPLCGEKFSWDDVSEKNGVNR